MSVQRQLCILRLVGFGSAKAETNGFNKGLPEIDDNGRVQQ
jgi:hypothetical protein